MAKARPRTAVVLPPAWNTLNGHITLWHGTVSSVALDIQGTGIDLTRGRPNLDFGRGFYTITCRTQAENWARIKHSHLKPAVRLTTDPAILRFQIPLDQIGSLDTMTAGFPPFQIIVL